MSSGHKWAGAKEGHTHPNGDLSHFTFKPIRCQTCKKWTTVYPHWDLERQKYCAKCWNELKHQEAEELHKKINAKDDWLE